MKEKENKNVENFSSVIQIVVVCSCIRKYEIKAKRISLKKYNKRITVNYRFHYYKITSFKKIKRNKKKKKIQQAKKYKINERNVEKLWMFSA